MLKQLILPVLAVGLTLPAQATTEAQQAAVWRSQLQSEFCGQDWTSAASTALVLSGSRISADDRQWAMTVRQNAIAIQQGDMEFIGCNPGIVLQMSEAQERRTLDWGKAVASIGGRMPGQSAPVGSGSAIAQSSSWVEIGQLSGGDRLMVKPSSMRTVGQFVWVQSRIELATGGVEDNGTYSVGCASQELYFNSSAQGSSVPLPIASGTVGEALWSWVCAQQ